MRVRDEGVWRDVVRARVYVEGAWRELNEVQAREDNAWVIAAEFVDDLSLSISPQFAGAVRVGSGFAVTDAATATPIGGRGPFTYQWERVSGVFAGISAPQSASTQFSFFLPPVSFLEGIYSCTVTDSLGSVASDTVNVTFESIPTNGRA